jgi:glycosyltransferase involved in cell wall biosynthesis
MQRKPGVSIGLPLYNGERHLEQTLDSILGQTFPDFELIISDNASTDRSGEICQQYRRRDRRIQYSRNPVNLGAACNFNRVFELSSGEYFKWAAHDDLIAPTYLERCVQALDRAPASVVLCFPHRRYITYGEGHLIDSPFGSFFCEWDCPESFQRLSFAELVRLNYNWCPMFVFGLMRASALRQTRLMGAYPAADLVLVAEMRLLGEFLEVPEDLYFMRLHLKSQRKTERQVAIWFDPANQYRRLLPLHVKLYLEYFRAIRRAPLGLRTKTHRAYDVLADVPYKLAGLVGWKLVHHAQTLRRLMQKLRRASAKAAEVSGRITRPSHYITEKLQ